MNKALTTVVLILSIFLTTSFAHAAIYYVPDDYATIQAALNATASGDTVIVRDGVYTGAGNVNLLFDNMSVTLQSENGPDSCAINCENSGRAAFFRNGDTSTIDGFTITDGYVSGTYPFNGGGAILCNGSSPTIKNCKININFADVYGGGIFCVYGSSPTVMNCEIIGNYSGGFGGGITAEYNSSVTISGCTIRGNYSAYAGGGIYCNNYCPVLIDNCTISGNATVGEGGGVFSYLSNTTITDTTISDNYAADDGGAIFLLVNSTGTMTNCSFTGNTSGDSGGALSCYNSSLDMNNCLVADNHAYAGGGLMLIGSASAHTIDNSTITGNWAFEGGGIRVADNAAPIVTNSILWNDWAFIGAEIDLLAIPSPTSLTVSYSDVEGGQSAVNVESGSTLTWSAGNIDIDPWFEEGPDGDYYLSQTAAGQGSNSPCVDAGSDTAANLSMDGYSTRTDGEADSGAVDMGYHYALIPELARINCLAPANESILSSPPTFTWTTDGGTDNAFAVDFSLSYGGPFYSSPIVFEGSRWTMTTAIWNQIPSGSYVYWKVRGADLDYSPLTIITSDELWWFYKQ